MVVVVVVIIIVLLHNIIYNSTRGRSIGLSSFSLFPLYV